MLAGPAGRLLTRRAVCTGLEMQIAESAIAAFDDQHFLVGDEQFGDHVACFLSVMMVPIGMRSTMSSAAAPY